MSTSRGNHNRNRPQKHQNKTTFKNDLHDTSKKTKMLNSLDVIGVCKRCKDIIQWKIKYKKYKPLTAPTKCVSCEEKVVKHAYHVLCTKCAGVKKVCCKCCKPLTTEVGESVVTENTEMQSTSSDLQSILKRLTERKRRTAIRYLEKHHNGETNVSSEVLDTLLLKLNIDENDDDDFDCASSDS